MTMVYDHSMFINNLLSYCKYLFVGIMYEMDARDMHLNEPPMCKTFYVKLNILYG